GDRCPQGETGGTYTDVSPKASCRVMRHASLDKPAHTASMRVRSGTHFRATERSRSGRRARERQGSARSATWPRAEDDAAAALAPAQAPRLAACRRICHCECE